VKVLEVDEIDNRLSLKFALAQLAEHGLASIFVESGGQLATSLLTENLVNKLYLFFAPKTLRDAMAKPAFGHAFQLELPEQPEVEIIGARQLEHDWLLEARPYRKNGTPAKA